MFEVERWIYTGKVKLKGNKVGIGFTLLEKDGYNLTDKSMYYLSKKSYAPGCIYEIEVERTEEKCSARFHTIRLIEKHPDQQIVDKFQLDNKLFNIILESERLEKKYKYDFQFPDNWGSIVEYYKTLRTYEECKFFETLLISQLKNDSRK